MPLTFEQDPLLGFTIKNVAVFAKSQDSTELDYTDLPSLTSTKGYALLAVAPADSGFNVNVGAAPSSTPVRSTIGNKEFTRIYTPSDDAATISGANLHVLDDGFWDYVLDTGLYVTGAVPPHDSFVLVAEDEAGDKVGWQFPYAVIALNGDMAHQTSGTGAVLQAPFQVSGDVDPTLGWKAKLLIPDAGSA